MFNTEKLNECFVDHEVRIRIQEKVAKDIHNLLRWILGTVIIAVIIPIGLKYFHLS